MEAAQLTGTERSSLSGPLLPGPLLAGHPSLCYQPGLYRHLSLQGRLCRYLPPGTGESMGLWHKEAEVVNMDFQDSKPGDSPEARSASVQGSELKSSSFLISLNVLSRILLTALFPLFGSSKASKQVLSVLSPLPRLPSS